MSKLNCARCPATFGHVQTVEWFLQALEIESFHLVGHSMGGLIALRLARRGRGALRRLLRIHRTRKRPKWGDLIDRARDELMAVIPQIVEEALLVSCDDLTGDDFSGIEVPTFLIGTVNGPPPAAPIIQRIAAAISDAEATQLAGAGHMGPIAQTADVGDAISGFLKRSAA